MGDKTQPGKEPENLSSKDQPDTCVQCGCELAIAMRQAIIAFPYCPNPVCPNYGLVTVGMSGVDNG